MKLRFSSLRRIVFVSALSLSLLVLGSVSAPVALAQGITTGGISGTVVDPTGSVVPFASINLVNAATGAKYTVSVREDGGFSLLNLPLGTYEMTISASGFSDLKIQTINVTVGVVALGNETLTVGKGVTTVEASAVAPMLSTEQSQISVTLDAEAIANLPFGGGFDTVALLTPGVAITHDNSFSNSNGSYGGFSSQGERGRSNNFEIDGQSNNDNSVAGPQVFFSNQDALNGVEVITNNFSAQYGRNAGSVVNYLTKSGTNTYHGSAFEFYEGNWGESFAQGQKSSFAAFGFCPKGTLPTASNPCTIPTLPRFVDNRFGGTIGGPIPKMRDKLWFFASAYFERYRNGGGTSTSGGSVTPTPLGLTQLQAAFPNEPGVAALVNNGPYSIKTGNPRVVSTPFSVPVTVGETSANVEVSVMGRTVPSLQNDEELLGRIDWQASSKDHIFMRYFYQDDPFINAGGGVAAGNWYNVPDTAHSIGADWSRTITPSIVNQVRYSFQQTKLDFQGGGQPNCTVNTPDQCTSSIGIAGTVKDPSTGLKYTNLGFGYASNIPQGRTVKVTQVQDNATWSHGKQTILFGGEWAYQNSPNPFLPNYNGTFSFSGLAGIVAGKAGSLQLGNGNGFTTAFTEPDFAAYFQDDYKVTPDLTLNMGLRWEFSGQAINLLNKATVKRESNPATAFWDPSLPLANRTIPKTPNNWKEFQPRIGLAFNPSFDKKLVIRSGFSINFDPAFYNMFLNVATAAPVVNLGSITGCGVSKQCLPSTGASGAAVRALDLPYIPTGAGINPGRRSQTSISPNFHNPYTESWLLGVSHQLGNHAVIELTYVGNHQVGNFQSINANPNLGALKSLYPGAVPATLCTDETQIGFGHPDCTRTRVRSRDNGAFGIYNAFQSKISTQNFYGLNAQFNFTYSKAIDNVSEIFATFAGGNTVAFSANPLNPNTPERGVSGNSMKFVSSSNFSYMLPKFHSGNGLVGRVLSGYRLDTIWTFNTGQPVTPYQYGFFGFGLGPSVQSYADASFLNSFSSGVDSIRPTVSNPAAPITTVGILDDGSFCGNGPGIMNWADCSVSSASAVHWLRSSQTVADAAKNPYVGVGRNTLHSSAWNNFDVSLQKETKLRENLLMTISVIAYNAMNRQYLGTPDLDVDDVGGSFYDYRYQYGSNRNTQLKIDFSF